MLTENFFIKSNPPEWFSYIWDSDLSLNHTIVYLLVDSALKLCSVSKYILKGLHISKVVSSAFGALVNQTDKIKTIKQKINKKVLMFGLKPKLPLRL